ncbi:WD repeat protein [Tritrichomonas foetus]|uniref:WD repeat protein n=1 Tax=Tritrichomonas foetus TaxID=1144522 RepID=A0A1J4KSL1_9EUKA|nr:WD repeat protein [Tritrichomonas foetus]|eukprot:OHT12461.1 WD repeat protein [Tritrichomonas foetus]
MARAIDTGSYLLEEAELEIDDSSDGEYVSVEVEDDEQISQPEPEESVDELPETYPSIQADDQPSVLRYNEVVDDYVRNFLKKMNMTETLATFQREWYEKQERPLFRDLSEEIADVKHRIQLMEAEHAKWQNVSEEVQQTWDRLKQERNYHREGLHALQKEKDDLTKDLRRMKKTKKRLDPALEELKLKFEQVNKERALLRIERDKLNEEIKRMQKADPKE